jgi:hypothetical protein
MPPRRDWHDETTDGRITATYRQQQNDRYLQTSEHGIKLELKGFGLV